VSVGLLFGKTLDLRLACGTTPTKQTRPLVVLKNTLPTGTAVGCTQEPLFMVNDEQLPGGDGKRAPSVSRRQPAAMSI